MSSIRSLAFLAVCLSAVSLLSQTADPSAAAQNSANKPVRKPRRVLTNEDLTKMHGGVSVVGEADVKKEDPTPPAAEPASATETNPADPAAPAPSETKPQQDNRTKEPAVCRSRSWAAIMAEVSEGQGLPLSKKYWHQKIFGHDFCTDSTGSIEKIANSIGGDQLLPDGNRVIYKVRGFRFLPDAEELVPAYDEGRILIVQFRGRPYMLDVLDSIDQAVTGGDGARAHVNYIIKSMQLRDPHSGEVEYFIKGETDPGAIEGSMYATVQPR